MITHFDIAFVREEINCKEKVERSWRDKDEVKVVERRRIPVI